MSAFLRQQDKTVRFAIVSASALGAGIAEFLESLASSEQPFLAILSLKQAASSSVGKKKRHNVQRHRLQEV